MTKTVYPTNSGKDFTEAQVKEFELCSRDFTHFLRTYIKIIHPKRGMIPFEVYDYQKRLFEHYETNRFSILTKFRQGGFTTTTLLYALWLCMFRLDQRILFVTKSDREAWEAKLQIIDKALKY